jgi:hypothetical protein
MCMLIYSLIMYPKDFKLIVLIKYEDFVYVCVAGCEILKLEGH